MNNIKGLTFVLFLGILSGFVNGQEVNDTTRYKIFLKNSSVIYKGTFVMDDGREMKFITDEIGPLILKKKELRRLEKLGNEMIAAQRAYLELNDESPFSTRYNFTTNAFPIKKGHNYFMTSLYGPEIHFALSDRLNVGYMTTWATSPMALSIKYSFKTKNEKIHFGIGSLLLSSGFAQLGKGYGALTFGSLTFGDRNKNFTVSAGYLYWKSGAKQLLPGHYSTEYTNQDSIPSAINASLRKQPDDIGFREINNWHVSDTSLTYGYPISGGVLGFNGTMPIGGSSHFVFETLIGNFKGTREVITQVGEPLVYNLNAPNDPWQDMYVHKFRYRVETVSYSALFIMLSPGVRFQPTQKFAWQVSMTSLVLKNSHDSVVKGIPLPMITLFKKL
jgi:hypothetical protein